jgi:hypothetical protein
LLSNLPATAFALSIDIYPNPVNDYAFLNFYLDSPKNLQIALMCMNELQTTLSSRQYNAGENVVNLDFSDKNTGIYLLVIFENGNIIYSKKIVKF